MDKANNGAKPQDGEQRGVGPIVHMRADSDSMLESMFAIALKAPGTEMPLGQKPMRLRNLPASFFKPPQMGSKSPSCHSRENSHDSTSLNDPYSPMQQNVGSPQPLQQQPPPPPPSGPAPPHHSRAHSSPATLQQTLVAVQQQQQQQHPQFQGRSPSGPMGPHNAHHRQASFDVNLINGDSLGPLPPGWERTQTANGQVYYMDHINKRTQWEDPRITHKAQEEQQQQQQQVSMEQQQLGPLPNGWEQGVTAEGEIYFIDHINHKTQWHDPRRPLSQQVVPLRVGGAAPPSISSTQQQRLIQLEQEKKNLIQRQSVLKLKQQRYVASNAETMQLQEMLRRQSLNDPNGDPFLTSTQQQQADLHNRQESADSGLGMGSNFNLGSIPEDISGMESMDTGDLDTTLTGESTPTAASSSGATASQQPPVSSADDHMMGAVDLGEDFSNEIINNLLNSRPATVTPGGGGGGAATGASHDTLTWL